MKKFRWDKKYLYWGITAFLVIAACLLFNMFITGLPKIKSALGSFMAIVSPFIWGLVIAYLLCPLMNIYQRDILLPMGRRLFAKSGDSDKKAQKFARGMAVFFALISLIVILTAVTWLIVPQVYQSLRNLVVNSNTYINAVYEWLDNALRDYPDIENAISEYYGNFSDGIFTFLSNNILPRIESVITNVTSGAYYVAKTVYNVIIGMIVSVYVLYNKELFSANVKKLIYCIFSVEASEKIIEAVQFVDGVFIGFISGKILDSAIIGIICYVFCLILKMPYALLVSVIVGITNIIPFFGPFIGGVPTTLIIFLESPMKALIFVIFVIVLQQFDGNFLGPKILGNSVGINGFWVMFSIIIGAGLFGFIGMVLGVPVFVIIYTGVTHLVNRKLRRSGLSSDSEFYKDISYIDPETGQGVRREEGRRQSVKKKKKKSKLSEALHAQIDPKKLIDDVIHHKKSDESEKAAAGDGNAAENAGDGSEGDNEAR